MLFDFVCVVGFVCRLATLFCGILWYFASLLAGFAIGGICVGLVCLCDYVLVCLFN